MGTELRKVNMFRALYCLAWDRVKGQLGRFLLLLSFKSSEPHVEVHAYPHTTLSPPYGINLDLEVWCRGSDEPWLMWLRPFWEVGYLKVLRLTSHRLVQQWLVSENHPCILSAYDLVQNSRKSLFKTERRNIRREEYQALRQQGADWVRDNSILGEFLSVWQMGAGREPFMWDFISNQNSVMKPVLLTEKQITGQYYVPVTFSVLSICIFWDIFFFCL